MRAGMRNKEFCLHGLIVLIEAHNGTAIIPVSQSICGFVPWLSQSDQSDFSIMRYIAIFITTSKEVVMKITTFAHGIVYVTGLRERILTRTCN